MNKAYRSAFLFIVIVLLNACPFNVVHVTQLPTALVTDNSTSSSFILDKNVNVSLGTGYNRTLRANTRWNYIGTTSYGQVFKSSEQILTVEASHIHEAYIVVSSSRLVGFYLPVEQSFSPLEKPVQLVITAVNVNP